jgi:uncharacterized membrane protein
MARVLILVLNTVAAGFIALGLCRWLSWPFSERRALGLTAFVLALAPLHTSMAIGQSAIVATGLIIAAILLDRSGRPLAAGIAYGLATAVKVQLGLPFLGYQLLRRRWTTPPERPAAAGLTVSAVVDGGSQGAVAASWSATWSACPPGGLNVRAH